MASKKVEDYEIVFLHELRNNQYTMTATAGDTGRILTTISMSRNEAIKFSQAIITTLMGDT